MAGSSVLKRLLWKEARRSGPPALALLVLPALLFAVSGRWAQLNLVRMSFDAATGAFLTAVLVLWPAALGRRDKRGMEFAESHLAVTPWAGWASSFLVPLLVCTLCGMWAGFSSAYPWPNTQAPEIILKFAVLWGVAFALVFGGVYLLSAAISEWAGTAAGLIITFATVLWLIGERTDLGRVGSFWPGAMRMLGEAAIGPVLGMLIFVGLSTKRIPRVREALALIVGLGIAVWALAPWRVLSGFSPFDYRAEGYAVVRSQDGARLLLPEGVGNHNEQANLLDLPIVAGRWPDKRIDLKGTSDQAVVYCYQDYRTQVTAKRRFPAQTQALGFSGDGAVLVRQDRKDARADLVLWNPGSPLRLLATIPFKRNASVLNGLSMGGWVAPSGRFALLITRPSNGTGSDVWLADLKTGRSEVVWPNRLVIPMMGTYQFGSVSWSGRQAIVSGVTLFGPFVVDTKTFTAHALDWPREEELRP